MGAGQAEALTGWTSNNTEMLPFVPPSGSANPAQWLSFSFQGTHPTFENAVQIPSLAQITRKLSEPRGVIIHHPKIMFDHRLGINTLPLARPNIKILSLPANEMPEGGHLPETL